MYFEFWFKKKKKSAVPFLGFFGEVNMIFFFIFQNMPEISLGKILIQVNGLS